MIPKLKSFYVAIHEWIVGGCVSQEFDVGCGLCAHYDMWCGDDDDPHELIVQFDAAGLSTTYPFNDGSHEWYVDERRNGNLYKNPRRLEWIRKHAMMVEDMYVEP